MNPVKPFLPYSDQIDKLKQRGCIISDEQFCISALTDIGYYRLSAYFLPFKKSDDTYLTGTTFESVFYLYEFDRKLRTILFGAIETVEVSLRSRLSYFHAGKYGPLGYLDPCTFNSKHNHAKFKENIDREIENSKKVLFVKHHIENYGGQFPLWVISELFTFGTLSYFYSDMKTADQKAFAGVKYKDMLSWLRCCTDLRNICAHYGRLYYRIFSAMPSGFHIPDSSKRRLWGAVLSLRELYPSTEKWNDEFVPALASLFDEYKEHINLYHIAFPEDWAIQLNK